MLSPKESQQQQTQQHSLYNGENINSDDSFNSKLISVQQQQHTSPHQLKFYKNRFHTQQFYNNNNSTNSSSENDHLQAAYNNNQIINNYQYSQQDQNAYSVYHHYNRNHSKYMNHNNRTNNYEYDYNNLNANGELLDDEQNQMNTNYDSINDQAMTNEDDEQLDSTNALPVLSNKTVKSEKPFYKFNKRSTIGNSNGELINDDNHSNNSCSSSLSSPAFNTSNHADDCVDENNNTNTNTNNNLNENDENYVDYESLNTNTGYIKSKSK